MTLVKQTSKTQRSIWCNLNYIESSWAHQGLSLPCPPQQTHMMQRLIWYYKSTMLFLWSNEWIIYMYIYHLITHSLGNGTKLYIMVSWWLDGFIVSAHNFWCSTCYIYEDWGHRTEQCLLKKRWHIVGLMHEKKDNICLMYGHYDGVLITKNLSNHIHVGSESMYTRPVRNSK